MNIESMAYNYKHFGTGPRWVCADARGNVVLRECGEPYTGLGPRYAHDLAQELTGLLGYKVFWTDLSSNA